MTYEQRSSRRLRFTAGSLYLLLVLFGCSTLVGSEETSSKQTLVETLLVIDQATSALDNSSADPRKILEGMLATLPPNSRDFVRADITSFLDRMPAAGADFKCGTRFLQYTARQQLWRVKDKLLNTNPQPAQPQFCYAAPFAVDTVQPTDALEIYGYDFDQAPLEIFIMNREGFFEDVSFALIQKTHYHLTVNLGKDGVKFSPESQTLSVAWGHLVRYSIPVIQLATPLCLSSIEEIPAGKTITYPPLVIDGNGRFTRPEVKVWASATLDYESNKVDATVCMTATEPGGATVSGCGVEYVYTSDPDRVIEWVFGGLQADVAYTHSNQAKKTADGSLSGPVAQWIFDGLGEKSTADTEAQITVQLRKIRVVSTDPGNCVSAIAYSEAKRMNALSLTTTDRLDSQLKKIDSEIITRRPRFAP